MKKVFLAISLLCTVILSCTKDHNQVADQQPVSETHKVEFKVEFSQELADFEANGLTVNSTTKKVDASLASLAKVMYLAVYDSAGHQASLIKQVSTDANFGTFSSNLRAGKYTVVAAAGQDGFLLSKNYVHDHSYHFIDTSSLSTDIINYGLTKSTSNEFNVFKDSFYNKMSLTVSGQNSSQSIALNRITSQEKVVIEDAIPANANSISFKIDRIGNKFYIGSGTPGTIGEPTIDYTATLKSTDIGTKGYNFKFTFLRRATPAINTIYCTSASGTKGNIATRVIQNVSYQANTVTVLTGNLFGGNGTSDANSTHFTADTAYSSTVITKTF